MEAVEVGERKTRDRVLNKACSHWTAVTNMTNQSNSANYTNTANSPVILVASNSPLSSSSPSSSATSSLKPRPCSPHVVSPVSSSLSPLSLHSHFSCLLSIPPPSSLFTFLSFLFRPWVYALGVVNLVVSWTKSFTFFWQPCRNSTLHRSTLSLMMTMSFGRFRIL